MLERNIHTAPNANDFFTQSSLSVELGSQAVVMNNINPLRTHQFPYKFASRGVFAITFLLFTTCMTTCPFLERYFDREAYSVIKNQETKKNVDQNHPRSGSQQECPCASSPSSKLWTRLLQHFQMYACTFFCCYAFPKPFATIWQCTSMFAWSGMRSFRPKGEHVVLHIFKYAVSVKG